MGDFVAQVLRIEGIAQVVHLVKRTVRNLYEADHLSKQEVLVLADTTTVVLAMNNGHHFLLDQSSPFMSQYHSVFIEDLVLASTHEAVEAEVPKESIPESIAKLLEESYISSNIKASLEGWVSSSIEPAVIVSRNAAEGEPLIDFRGLTQPIPFDEQSESLPRFDEQGRVLLKLSGLEQVSEDSVANYTLTLSAPPVTTLTVVLAVGNQDANATNDDAPTLSVIFAPNQMTASFGIQMQMEEIMEGDETFQVSVIQVQGGGFEQSLALPEPIVTTVQGEAGATTRSILPELMESESMDACFSYIRDFQEGGASKLLLASSYSSLESETVQFLVNELSKNEWLEMDLTEIE